MRWLETQRVQLIQATATFSELPRIFSCIHLLFCTHFKQTRRSARLQHHRIAIMIVIGEKDDTALVFWKSALICRQLPATNENVQKLKPLDCVKCEFRWLRRQYLPLIIPPERIVERGTVAERWCGGVWPKNGNLPIRRLKVQILLTFDPPSTKN